VTEPVGPAVVAADDPPPLLEAGRVALITGGSSGIGEAFARALAGRGLQLIVTGRDETRLRAIVAGLRERHQVRVEPIVVELSAPDAPERLKAAVDHLDLSPDILVNNAGVGAIGTFAELPLERQLEMVGVNVEALVAITSLFLPAMLARGRGGIVNTSSAAGLQPLPHYAVYGASKAFVNSFSQALWAEVRGTGVRVVAVCPGPVADTRFGERSGGSSLSKFPGLASRRQLSRETVVALALDGLVQGDPLVVPGLTNRLMARLAGTLPRRFQLVMTERIFRPRGTGRPERRSAGRSA
jgi:short-subunit dehydrogenase